MEDSSRDAEARIASHKRAIVQLLEQMPSAEDSSEALDACEASESSWLLRRAQDGLRDATERRTVYRDFYLPGRLHCVKNGFITFFKAYSDIGIKDIFECFIEPGQVHVYVWR